MRKGKEEKIRVVGPPFVSRRAAPPLFHKARPIFGPWPQTREKISSRVEEEIAWFFFEASTINELTPPSLSTRFPLSPDFLSAPNRGNEQNQEGTGSTVLYALKNSPILYRIPIGPPRGAKNWRCFTRQEQKEKEKTRARCTLSDTWSRIPQEIDRGKGVYRRDRRGTTLFFLLPLPFFVYRHGKIVKLGLPAITMTIVTLPAIYTCVRNATRTYAYA